jgi:hypothetical protein
MTVTQWMTGDSMKVFKDRPEEWLNTVTYHMLITIPLTDKEFYNDNFIQELEEGDTAYRNEDTGFSIPKDHIYCRISEEDYNVYQEKCLSLYKKLFLKKCNLADIKFV